MHCAFQGTLTGLQKDTNGNNSPAFEESLEDDDFSGSTEKDIEVSSIGWEKHGHMCAISAFSSPESNRFRYVLTSSPSLKHQMCLMSPQINMDELNLDTSLSVDSFKNGEQKTHITPITDKDHPGESQSFSSIARPQFLRWSSIKRFVNDGTNWKVFAISSCQKPFISVEYPLVISSESGLANSADNYAQRNIEGNDTKTRGKINDLSRGCRPTERCSEIGSLKSQAYFVEDVSLGVNLPSHASKLAVSLPVQRRGGVICGSNQNIIINSSTSPRAIPSCTLSIDTSEDGQAYSCQDFISRFDPITGSQVGSPEGSFLNQEGQNVSQNLIRCSDLYYTGVDEPMLADSVSFHSKDGVTSALLSNEEGAGVGISKSVLCGVKKEFPSPKGMLGGHVEPCSQTCRTNPAYQGADRDRKSHAFAKKVQRFNKVPQDSSVRKISSFGNLNWQSGKENTHSMWQKVQRNDAGEFNLRDNVVHSLNSGHKQAPSHRKHHTLSNSDLLSESEVSNLKKDKVPRKGKRRKGSRSKQEVNSCCQKESHAIKSSSCNCPVINTDQSGVSGVQVTRQKEFIHESHSYSRRSSRTRFQAKKDEPVTYKPVQKSEAPIIVEAFESIHATYPIMNVQIAENYSNLAPPPCSFPELPEVHKEVGFVNDDGAQILKEISSTGQSEQNVCFTAVPQKQVSLGVNDLGKAGLSHSAFSVKEPKLADKSFLTEEIGRKLAPGPCNLAAFTELNHSSQGPKYTNAFVSENGIPVQRLFKNGTWTPKDYGTHTAFKGLICEYKNQIVCDTESDMTKIVQAVNDVHKAQLASEAIKAVTGCRIAEFEKFIYSTSPVICKSQHINICQVCSPGHSVGLPLCEHETPNLSLGNLWQWYEKHGTCGLEVRAEDYEDSKRLGMDQFAFRAYFVPYLSAVQLFRECKSRTTQTHDSAISSHNSRTFESSSIVDLPSVYPTLVPQTRAGNSNTPLQMNLVSKRELALVRMIDKIHDGPTDSEFSDCELIFEYFESEQPQQRRPLFEMINALARGERPSKSRLYGDPSILESASLDDLHPSSWYSVAWYPIYRIPDGKLRAAFLTYHSFGHLVHRGLTFDSPSMDASVVSPAVGLQCYNAQGECWFRPRRRANCRAELAMDMDPSQILKERIRTLEHTASVMARAVVTVGSQKHANRQPDYEFFLSRRY